MYFFIWKSFLNRVSFVTIRNTEQFYNQWNIEINWMIKANEFNQRIFFFIHSCRLCGIRCSFKTSTKQTIYFIRRLNLIFFSKLFHIMIKFLRTFWVDGNLNLMPIFNCKPPKFPFLISKKSTKAVSPMDTKIFLRHWGMDGCNNKLQKMSDFLFLSKRDKFCNE